MYLHIRDYYRSFLALGMFAMMTKGHDHRFLDSLIGRDKSRNPTLFHSRPPKIWFTMLMNGQESNMNFKISWNG